jgi:excisionase family DNA binding protein
LPALGDTPEDIDLYLRARERDEEASRRRAARREARVTYTVGEAAELLGIGRSFAYDLIRRDEFPTPVIKLGSCDGAGAPRRIVIPKAPLVALLREHEPGEDCDE